MRRAVIVILDGLRRDFVDEHRTPALAALSARAEYFPGYRSAFPSATRVVSSTLATGCWPARHGLAGNTMALIEEGRLVRHDAGHPDFLQHKRSVTGASLAVPTLAQRVARQGGAKTGGAVIFNNVSPGAAYAHDPDGHGRVYHRAGSFGPGRMPLADGLDVTLDAGGDRIMTHRFVNEALVPGGPALAVLWLGEPDHVQHSAPLGSPEHLGVLKAADANLARVVTAVDALRAAGEDVLLIAGSDHGHETVSGIVDIEDELVAAGLKAAPDSDDVVVCANGTAALVYLHPDHDGRRDRLGDFLASRPWAGAVMDADTLPSVGQVAAGGLAFAVSMKGDNRPNAFGVPGSCLAVKPQGGKADRLGFGQHGGLNAHEQAPVLVVDGPGFAAGGRRDAPVAVVDIAPTVLTHLGLPAAGMDGAALQLPAVPRIPAPPASLPTLLHCPEIR
ncbi:alkaline phosphatase family protein [Ancylobacter sp. MQZ15Z-1]|uniref:Alkaline phosphatase family protein n=1 Tax=Ancylobacter mangrovi TaxID=2972472 RepID=A0A9X2T5X7_9HYPH|nr:alkaline phosphatase family protein [Ancylobacter mangrovi]MCS0495849.1 alkaline phosphatase family protein [Ancylobacter mangrovi]